MKRKIVACAGMALSLALISNAHGQTVNLRYGQLPSTLKTMGALQFYVAQRKGFFTREGINLQMIPIEGGADNMVLALDQDKVDVTRTGTSNLIHAVLRRNSEGVAIAGETATPVYSLIAKPEIRSFADLKGKLIALPLPAAPISISTRKLIALNGLRDEDYRVKQIVGTPGRTECLKSGECDAVPLGQPDDITLMAQGFTRLGISTDAVPNYQFMVSAVKRSWGEKNRETLIRYIRGLASALRYMRDTANRDEIVNIIVNVQRPSESVARQIMTLYFEPDRGVFPKQAELDIKGVGNVIEFMAHAGQIKAPLPTPERFVDLLYLQAAGMQ
jgi:ABC-type nitrate/sulfonate/bicarbonate transport system substrate-binding protein